MTLSVNGSVELLRHKTIETTGSWGAVRVCLDPALITDWLDNLESDSVEFRAIDANSAVHAISGQSEIVVMPLNMD